MAKDWLKIDDDGLLAETIECISCGEDIEGASPSGRCPKCHDLVLDSLTGMGLAQVDEEGRLKEDIACAVCRYSLRTLMPEGECPECGAAVSPSLEGLPIRYFGPKWLNTMSQGTLLYLIAGITAPVLGLAMIGIRVATKDEAILATCQMLASVVVMAFAVPALWFLTTPQPRRALAMGQREFGCGMRQAARYVGLLGYVMGLVQGVSAIFYPGTAMVGGMLAIPVGMIAFATLFTHLGRTARVIPDERLVKHTRIVTWLMIGSMTAAFLGMIIMTAGFVLAGIPLAEVQNIGNDPEAAEAMKSILLFLLAGGLFSVVGGLGALASTVYSLILVWLFRRRFSAAAKMIPLENEDT